MSDLRSLLVDIVAGAVLFGLGFFARQLISRSQARKISRFWRPFGKSDVTFVIGKIDNSEILAYEPTGVVGLGDLRALDEVGAIFFKAGYKRRSVAYIDTLTSEQRNGNLVLFGGIDGNHLSAELMRAVGSRIELTNEGNQDRVTPPVLLDHVATPPNRYQPRLQGGKVTADYGVLIRARNPRNRDNWVVIIAGCLGFGTWAGVAATRGPDLAHAPDEFELVYESHSDGGVPSAPVFITGFRRLPR